MLGAFRPAAPAARPAWPRPAPGFAELGASAGWSAPDRRPRPTPGPRTSAAAALPLGVARAQLHETYIVAQTADGW